MVSYANREEKGSDVNVAAHLLLDVLAGAVDGAVVTISSQIQSGGTAVRRTGEPGRRGSLAAPLAL